MFSGKIDEAIETSDEVLIIERKYSDYVVISPTIKTQLGLLAILAEENFGKKVKRAIIVFDKTKRIEIQVKITNNIKQLALSTLQKTRDILSSGIIPLSRHDNRCLNCCYRKICPPGTSKRKPSTDDPAKLG
jgi:CRISPR-associated exonuclease Cas4